MLKLEPKMENSLEKPARDEIKMCKRWTRKQVRNYLVPQRNMIPTHKHAAAVQEYVNLVEIFQRVYSFVRSLIKPYSRCDQNFDNKLRLQSCAKECIV